MSRVVTATMGKRRPSHQHSTRTCLQYFLKPDVWLLLFSSTWNPNPDAGWLWYCRSKLKYPASYSEGAPIMSAIVALGFLLLLASLATKKVKTLTAETTELARTKLAGVIPGYLCIDGDMGYERDWALSASTFTACATKTGQDELLPQYIDYPLIIFHDGSDVREYAQMLQCCGILQYWYSDDEMSQVISGAWSEMMESRKRAVQEWQQQWGSIACQANFHVLQARYNDTVLPPSGGKFKGVALGEFQEAVGDSFAGAININSLYYAKVSKERADSQIDYVNKLTPYRNVTFDEYSAVLNGTWMIWDGADGTGGRMWLSLSQSWETAECLKDHAAPEGIALMPGICPEAQGIFLIPGHLHSYRCTNGIDETHWNVWSDFLFVAQQQSNITFLHFIDVLSYADMYALYTAALGALFAGFALVIGNLACMLPYMFVLMFRGLGNLARATADGIQGRICGVHTHYWQRHLRRVLHDIALRARDSELQARVAKPKMHMTASAGC